MRIAYFEPLGGAAGDMILGALVDVGLCLDTLRTELSKISIAAYSTSAARVRRHNVEAIQFLVNSEARHHHGDGSMPGAHSMLELIQRVEGSRLGHEIKSRAASILARLAEAEGAINGKSPSELLLDEASAIDLVVDVAGACIGLDILGAEMIWCAPLPLGSGSVETRHGNFPITSPTTRELVRRAGYESSVSTAGHEQVTPTGAAILTTLATFGRPSFRVNRVGYGSGETEREVANVLKVSLGDSLGD